MKTPAHLLPLIAGTTLLACMFALADNPPAGIPGRPQSKSDAGAKLWSLHPPTEPALPAVKREGWVHGPIDQFVLAKLEEKGLSPVGAADKRTLIRRATFDLTGLPPTPEEIDAFLADTSSDAFAKVIDRLLASDAYGECWGRHWLDVVRYADTGGDTSDYPLPPAYRYRDWVISAFNRDLPYDQFLKMQIAGDLMITDDDDEHRDNIVATGFIALSRRFSGVPEKEMPLTIDDTIDTMGRSFMGLTIGCARCHDHKFDPISTADYYGLYGIFDSTQYPQGGSEDTQFPCGMVPLDESARSDPAYQEYLKKMADLDAEFQRLREEWLKKGTGDQPSLAKMNAAKAARVAFAREHQPKIDVAYAVTDGDGHDAPIFIRGDREKPGRVVSRGFPAVLGGQKLPSDEKGSGRLELADWVADARNPLTARVMVNRVWQYHFGHGIVHTPSDFGTRGTPPTHPELLDYLALRFVQSGWSIKAMHRMIMLSATYQLAASADGASAQVDANNDYFWHFQRHRLDAEAIRDSLLDLSGELDRTPAGPHPFPPVKSWHFTQHAAFSADYVTKHRSVYLMQQRIRRQPYLAVFDGPDSNATTPLRSESTTPLQALFMMNDPFVQQMSQAYSARLLAEAPDGAKQLELAYARTLGRPPTADELADAQAYLSTFTEQLKATRFAKNQYPKLALASYLRVLLSSNEFLFVE